MPKIGLFLVEKNLYGGFVEEISATVDNFRELRSRRQTWKKLFFDRKPIFGVEKCPQIKIDPKHIKVPKIAIFLLYQIFSNKNALNVDNNADLWALMGENCKKIVV